MHNNKMILPKLMREMILHVNLCNVSTESYKWGVFPYIKVCEDCTIHDISTSRLFDSSGDNLRRGIPRVVDVQCFNLVESNNHVAKK